MDSHGAAGVRRVVHGGEAFLKHHRVELLHGPIDARALKSRSVSKWLKLFKDPSCTAGTHRSWHL